MDPQDLYGLPLDRFVPEGIDWAHFDTFAWRPAGKPGRPKGGDALGLRAAWRMLQARFREQSAAAMIRALKPAHHPS